MTEKIHYREGYKYQLAKDYYLATPIRPEQDIVTDYVCLGVTGCLYIRGGYAWDGASGPTIDTKSSMRGSLVHDALYQLMRMGQLDRKWRKKTDEFFEKLCKEDGMLSIRASVWERMVRWFAAGAASPENDRPILVAP